jgi:hypothetical protein
MYLTVEKGEGTGTIYVDNLVLPPRPLMFSFSQKAQFQVFTVEFHTLTYKRSRWGGRRPFWRLSGVGHATETRETRAQGILRVVLTTTVVVSRIDWNAMERWLVLQRS